MIKGEFKTIVQFIFGSWWSIIGHTILFLFVFLSSAKDQLFFTMFLSIEAIYIGIFILMAEFREQEEQKKHQNQRHKDRQLIREDVNIDQITIEEIKIMKRNQEKIIKTLEYLKNKTTTP